jgi:hypothetical protein
MPASARRDESLVGVAGRQDYRFALVSVPTFEPSAARAARRMFASP